MVRVSSPRLSALPCATPSGTRLPLVGQIFDATAMRLIPIGLGLLGYRFRVGVSQALCQDAHAVLEAVWSEEGAQAPADLAHLGERYDRAVSVWIVAYHRGRPVGVMALCDPRIASLGLDCWQRRPPAEVDLSHTREIGRLAILRAHRGRGQTVMIGLLREMLAWSRREEIIQLLVASAGALFRVYQRFNPAVTLLDWPVVPDEDEAPEITRYFTPVRQWGRQGAVYRFATAGASPWHTLVAWLTTRQHPRGGRGWR